MSASGDSASASAGAGGSASSGSGGATGGGSATPNASSSSAAGAAAPSPSRDPRGTPKEEKPKVKLTDPTTGEELSPAMVTLVSILSVLGGLFYLVFAYGAAKLSYDRFANPAWAILGFLFPMFYYPYYALFVSGAPTQFGGRKTPFLARILPKKLF